MKNKKVAQEDFAEHRIEMRLLVADQILQQAEATRSQFEKLELRIKRLECNHPKLKFEAHHPFFGPLYFLAICESCGKTILSTECKSEWLIAKQHYLQEVMKKELDNIDRQITNSEPCADA